MNLIEIQDFIIQSLSTHLDLPPVMQDQTGKKLEGPFLAFKFISPFIPESGQPIRHYRDTENETKTEYDVITMDTMVLSFSIYAKDYDVALNKAYDARNWFLENGYEVLKDFNLVVANIGTIEDRGVFIVHDYERRMGMDITIRFTNTATSKTPIPSIGNIEIEKEE